MKEMTVVVHAWLMLPLDAAHGTTFNIFNLAVWNCVLASNAMSRW
jgi:hypothetical protein